MIRFLLSLLLLSACAKPATATAPRPPPAGRWTSGQAGQVAATKVYLSSGTVRLCLRSTLAGDARLPVRLEIGKTKSAAVTIAGFSTWCEYFHGVQEGDEARLVFDGTLNAELRAELWVEDANP